MAPKSSSKSPLRGRKLKICKCYYDHLRDGKLPPTFEEIAVEVRLYDSSTVNYHINDDVTGLLKKGFVYNAYEKRKYRNYELTEYGIKCVEAAFDIGWVQSILNTEQVEPILNTEQVEPVRGIPLLGTTAAGVELEFINGEPGETIVLEHELGSDNIFAVRVSGNSMTGDHIDDGDCVFIRQQSACDNGDIILAVRIETLVERGLEGFGYATLKHFFEKEDSIHLQSSNDEVDDIIIPKHDWRKEWRIQGKVVAIFHRLYHI